MEEHGRSATETHQTHEYGESVIRALVTLSTPHAEAGEIYYGDSLSLFQPSA